MLLNCSFGFADAAFRTAHKSVHMRITNKIFPKKSAQRYK